MARKKRNKANSRATEAAKVGGGRKARSRVAQAAGTAVSKVKEVLVGAPNEAVAPGAFQQLFRYSQLAVGEAGAARNIDDIWATFLDDVASLGVPQDTVTRLQGLGGSKVLKASGFDKSVTAALDAPTLKALKESHRLAKAAVSGIKDAKLGISWGEMLDEFAKDADFADDNGKRLLKELRKVDPKTVARVGSNQTLSVVARRGEDPFFLRQFNKVFKRENTAVLPEKFVTMLKDTNKGILPKVEATAAKAIAKGGGAGLAGGVGRKAIGLLGKGVVGAVGTGLVVGLEANRALGILGREGRAREQAELGVQQLGPSSSVEFLRERVNQQELIARRKTTMQKFEPELFDEVVRVLADSGGAPNELTSTERRIGSDARAGVERRGRSSEDTQFLLDQMFGQMNNSGGQ